MANRQRVFVVGIVIGLVAVAITSRWVSIPISAVAAAAVAAILITLASYAPGPNFRIGLIAVVGSVAMGEIRRDLYPVALRTEWFVIVQSVALVLLFMIIGLATYGKRRRTSAEDRVA